MFGKTQRGVSERPNKPKKPLIPKWLGTLVAILAVLCIAVMLMLWKPWQPVPAKNQITSEHYQEEDTNKDYRFYDLLPQQQVTPIPEQAIPESKNQGTAMIVEAPSTTEPAASESVGIDPNQSATTPQQPTYILQVRSYNDPDQADARRAEIILNGLSADVVKSTENRQTWYRVISGPYDTQDAALAAQQTLQHSGIDSIVIKRK
ncbi:MULTISPECIES: SPOR domain-containing protein [Acinetobacter calcoaceticus/baumannii complex]|uniref:SPOR domain-containing protein n=1 Tax=Acinetobacter calcoaceticus/baumannii complex TaxID=909768 RepID=UPI00044E67F3|nr:MULTISPECIES: SPOR domain-containing protein [Acinetobacter calcoaceticus/baumannii complex]EXR98594.1 sporulation related domain protein [Acinetobacter sp. 225588]KCY49826.1 sporulation related domain protein [Acinetobacter baumannii 1288284]MBJ8492071.1 SPOR domain-containing protein [Acinetobacter pittii]MCG9523046.1 SPOR domain-containing protein [Acinetobacter pittii]